MVSLDAGEGHCSGCSTDLSADKCVAVNWKKSGGRDGESRKRCGARGPKQEGV
jgi:hypothetical protein